MKSKRTLYDIPDALQPLNNLMWTCCHFGWHPLGEPESEEEKQLPVFQEWERFKASKFYPNRFGRWVDHRMTELGYGDFDLPGVE